MREGNYEGGKVNLMINNNGSLPTKRL